MPGEKASKIIIVDTFTLVNETTGIRTYTLQLCDGLRRYKERKYKYIIPFYEHFSRSTYLTGRLTISKKIIFHSCYFFWKQVLLPLLSVWHRANAIICVDFVAPVFSFSKLKFSVYHDTFFWEYHPHYNRHWLRFTKKLIRESAKRKTIIVATSQYTQKKILQLLHPPCPVEVIYQAPKNLLLLQAPKIIFDLGVQADKYFLHVGCFDKRKNLAVLVKAFNIFLNANKNTGIKLVLAGMPGYASNMNDYPSIQQLVYDNGLEQYVLLPGYIKEEDLGDLYAHCLAYIFPSIDEGFGIPTLEAMSLGAPTIVSNKGALSEVSGGASVVFEFDNIEDLRSKMELMLDSRFRSEIIELGYQRAKKFTRPLFVKAFDDMIGKYV